MRDYTCTCAVCCDVVVVSEVVSDAKNLIWRFIGGTIEALGYVEEAKIHLQCLQSTVLT